VSFRISSRIDKQGNSPSERSQFPEGMAFWESKKRDSGRVAANRKQSGFHGGISPVKSAWVADLKNFRQAGYYGIWLGLAPDDSPVLLRDTGTQEIYALDWQAP